MLDAVLARLVELCERGEIATANICNPGAVSHNQILEMHRNIIDPEFSWQNFTREEQGARLAAGRSNNRMETTRLKWLCPGSPARVVLGVPCPCRPLGAVSRPSAA